MGQITVCLTAVILFYFSIVIGQISMATIDVSAQIVSPKKYIITKSSSPIIIDGIANESSWALASFTENFIDIEGLKAPKFDTKVKMIWDEHYLYVYAEMKEEHVWANIKERDAIIYYNNDFEVFVDPSGTGRNYGEIEVNALNTVWDLLLDKPYRVGGKAIFEWNLNDMESAVHIDGTLNVPTDIDSFWTVELAIPLKPLIQLKTSSRKTPIEGEQWRINFSRVEWDFDLKNGIYDRKKDGDNYAREYNWVWSNQKVVNMHEPEKWGFLQFTEAQSTKDIIFLEDKDILIKQTAFALFKKSRFGDLKYLLDNDTGFVQPIEVTFSKDKVLKTKFTKTSSGFEYTFESPFTLKKYQIDNHGNLKVL
jgi:hypothetical protein